MIIDCLTLTVSAQQDQAKETLEAVRRVTQELGLHTMLGVSNISFGLPERIRITENFLVQALYCGLDLPILNPNQRQIMDAVATFRVLSGEDVDSAAYIDRFANAEPAAAAPAAPAQLDLETAVARGPEGRVCPAHRPAPGDPGPAGYHQRTADSRSGPGGQAIRGRADLPAPAHQLRQCLQRGL